MFMIFFKTLKHLNIINNINHKSFQFQFNLTSICNKYIQIYSLLLLRDLITYLFLRKFFKEWVLYVSKIYNNSEGIENISVQ